ncbi:MAG: hypothetical protein HYX68_16635 [Planctomycetes bacterium]|nr:hypothetical protein [Planctomycetota bacterium]
MTAILQQLIAVVTSLILALPPGSCCVFVQNGPVDSTPVKKASCCHKTAPKPPCDSGKSPAKPSVKCCCERDAALPENSVQTAETHDLAFNVVADHVPLNVGSLIGDDAEFAPVRSGPSLQILLCVWRC